jgi:ArsR family transcriptional regulator
MDDKEIKRIVKKRYSEVAESSRCCGCESTCSDAEVAETIGYDKKDITNFSDANLGLGCGNPTALGEIQEGEIVLDLGSGPGLDCFLASKMVGDTGHVIGVDMTEAMIKKAQENAEKYGISNVEFRYGEISDLPVESESVDVILSNCVINLAPNKTKVFQEAFRVLKPSGRMYISDIVLLDELTPEQRQDEDLIAGCVGGAVLKDEYLQTIQDVGFKIKDLAENKSISKEQYPGLPLESMSIVASKH